METQLTWHGGLQTLRRSGASGEWRPCTRRPSGSVADPDEGLEGTLPQVQVATLQEVIRLERVSSACPPLAQQPSALSPYGFPSRKSFFPGFPSPDTPSKSRQQGREGLRGFATSLLGVRVCSALLPTGAAQPPSLPWEPTQPRAQTTARSLPHSRDALWLLRTSSFREGSLSKQPGPW